ncbi:hypothetical protein [Paenibacillus sp. TSA_86.1]|uniref:hypothetical protein n=1 Tax=Paenibacillus sp. TSA_86.1 TaxID=3415649 RepID=UPI004046321E
MIYSNLQSLEEYLNSIKVKNPQHVEEARRSLKFIVYIARGSGNKVEDELQNIRTHYQAQLSLISSQGNNIAIIAVLISLIIGFFSIVPSSPLEKSLFVPVYFLIIYLMFRAFRINKHFNKNVVTYTILMQIIDELLESKDFD